MSDRVDFTPWQVVTGLVYGVTIATGNNPVQTIRYSYDPLNRLSSLVASGPANFAYSYTYDAAGRLTAAGPGRGERRGQHDAWSMTPARALTRLLNRSPNGGGDLQRSTLHLRQDRQRADRDGRRQATTTYTYDALYQLTGVSGPGINETYAYDEAGNRVRKGGVTYSYDAADQLISSSDGATYTYDAKGNLRTKTLGGQTTTYTWDSLDRLARIDFPDGTLRGLHLRRPGPSRSASAIAPAP